MIVVKSVRTIGLSLLLLAPFGIGQAEPTRIPSRCSGPGPFALRINPDLLREDLRVEEVEELPLSRTVDRSPGQERQARRGVCQDPQTGRTVFEREVHLPSLRRLPREDGSTGGVEDEPLPGEVPRSDDLPGPRVVIGSDQRVIQSPATSFPFRAVAKLIMTYQNDPNNPKKTFGCTGSFIGGFHVLTAGHCVFKQPTGAFPNIFGWADSVLVIPGFDGGSSPTKPFGQAFVSKPLRSFKSWTDDGDTEGDFGLITLDQTFTVGSFGLLYPSDGTLDSTTAQLIGYPGDLGSPAGQQQAFVPGGGAITDHESEIIFYQIDTAKGQSGSGVYRFWNGKRAIFAVHHGGPCSSAPENCGGRITKFRHDKIRGWQCADGQPISGVC